MFKKLTGRDTVSANVKFESPIQFENHATLLFACNRMPVLKDDTRGNWRRWLLVDFPNTFEPCDGGTIPKRELMDRLTYEEELQGLLARCVEEIKSWDDGRDWFPNAPDWKQARRRIRRAAEPIYDFAHTCLEDSDGGYETTDDVHRGYQRYAEEEGLPGKSREQFGKELLSLTDYTIEKKRKRVDGRRTGVYENIVFTSRGEDLAVGGGPAAEEEDSGQSSFGGPQGRAQRVVQLCRENADDGAVPEQLLVGLAVGDGMNRDEAERAIQKAQNQGDLQGQDDLLPT